MVLLTHTQSFKERERERNYSYTVYYLPNCGLSPVYTEYVLTQPPRR
jgi:hypothetical protein